MWGGGFWEKHVENSNKLANGTASADVNQEAVRGYWEALREAIAQGLYIPTSEGFPIQPAHKHE